MIRAFILAASLLLLHRLASAQLRGSVVDSAGAPLPGAMIEAWAGLRQVGSVLSDEDGQFRMGNDAGSPVTGLIVRRIGYERLDVAVTPTDSVLRLRMIPRSVMLEGITATAVAGTCPNREDPRERSAWEAVRARYPASADTMFFHSLALFQTGEVSHDEIELVGGSRGSRGWSAGSTAAWSIWQRQIRAGGYAIRLRSGFGERYALWQYAPLEMLFSQHLVDPLFGELHTFSVAALADGRMKIRFCPRDQRAVAEGRPEIEGTLTLSADGILLGGSWRYRTPRPLEDAGGEVDFLSPAVTTEFLLLPERSLYWRRTNGGRYYVEGRRFEEWRLFHGKTAPPPPTGLAGSFPAGR